MYSSEITEKMLHGNENIIIEPSYVICEGLIECGRFSFGGMNKDVERIIEQEEQAKRVKKEDEVPQKQKEMKKDVADDEMIQYYNSLMKTVGKKFEIRKQRTRPAIGPPGLIKPNINQFERL